MPEANFNEKHPELRVGEVFVTNIGTDDDLGEEYPDDPFWRQLQSSYKTVRLGEQAYDINGERVGGFPVFASASEVEAKRRKWR